MNKSATSLDFPPLLFPERVADASIRGFLAQIYRTALRWLDLPDGEFLLCEGDEDLDHYFFNGDGTLREISQEQFKELSSKLSARSPEVYESIFNFLYLFAEHERAGRKCRFVFTTNASRAGQSVSKKETVVLDIDLLKTWSELSLGSDKDQQQRRLQIQDNVRKLVNGYGNKPSPKPSRSSMTPERIKTAIEFLDEDPTRWDTFINAVKWSLEDKPYDSLGKSLIDRLSKDPRTVALPDLFGYRIIIEVLHASVKTDPRSRRLSAQRLSEIFGKTKDELLHWAESQHAERLKDWFATIDARLDEHDRRLEDQAPLAHLRRLSRRTLRRLERSSALKSKGLTLTINRGIQGAMVQMLGSFLIVGDAGCGKSVALARLARHLEATNEVFVMSADELPGVADLIHDIFAGWTDGAPPILIIDALDAARGEESANKVWRFLEEFIAENSQWRVIASSRTYDLMARQSRAKTLFSGEPSKLSADSRLPSVAHVRIGPLDDSEIEQLASFAELHTLFHRVTPALQTLLRVPFNLALATELLNEGIEASAIERVQTHLGLLDLYWRYRVEELEPITEELARRKTLRAACDRMIVDRRFWVDDMQLPESTVLHSLLSVNVLTRADTEQSANELRQVGFSHLIFFDYACAKLWLPDDPEELVRVLHQHPDLVLVAGPSLGMYMRRLWARDQTRTTFWNVVLHICKDTNIREIVALIGPKVAAEEAVYLSEMEPLLRGLEQPDETIRKAAERAMRQLQGALMLAPTNGRPLIGSGAGPWCAFVEAVVARGQTQAKFNITYLLDGICGRNELSGEDLSTAGRAARAYFAWVDAEGTHAPMIARAAKRVIKTFSSHPTEASICLRSLLRPDRIASFGYETLFELSNEVPLLLRHDPSIVEDLYVSAFMNVDTSNEWLGLGGRVFGLRHRRSDMYSNSLHLLSEHYLVFLSTVPERALRALVRILEILRPHAQDKPMPMADVFEFNSTHARVLPDASYYWDMQMSGRGSEQLEMLDAFEQHLIEVCESQDHLNDARALIDTLIRENGLAGVWRRVLRAVAQHPTTVGPYFKPLLWSDPILRGVDTSSLAGDCLRVLFTQLAPDERIRVEAAIMAIGTDTSDEFALEERARLLNCLPRQEIVTPEAARVVDEWAQTRPLPPNTPPIRMGRATDRPYREESDWERDGVPLERADHAEFLTWYAPVKNLVENHGRGEVLSPDALTVTTASLRDLFGALGDAKFAGIDPVLHDAAWGKLLAACSIMVDSGLFRTSAELPHDIQAYAIAALAYATGPSCAPNSGYLLSNVAKLLFATVEVTSLSVTLEQAIELLSQNQRNDVRFVVAQQLSKLRTFDEQLMCRVLERFAQSETDAIVWAGLGETIGDLSIAFPDQMALVCKTGLERSVTSEHWSATRGILIQRLNKNYVLTGNATAQAILLDVLEHPEQDGLDALTWQLVAWAAQPDIGADYLARVLFVLHKLVTAATSMFDSLVSCWDPDNKESQDALKRVVGILKQISRTACRQMKELTDEKPSVVDDARLKGLKELYRRLGSTLEQLGSTGIPPVVHDVVRAFSYCIDVDCRGAFLKLARAVEVGQKEDYQSDPLAIDTIVAVVERYLVDHRALLQDDSECRSALLSILDIFVRAGWPEARALTYGLEEIFR